MPSSPLISIIVPVYNVRQYLKKCIESILCQTYSNIELILVDDGSTDGSSEICDNFEKQNANVKCIHKQNEGVSKARQVGFVKSVGEWIVFADSDDELPCDAIEKLVRAYENLLDVDIVVGGYQYIPKSKFQLYYKNEKISNEQLIVKYLRNQVHTGPVAKLIRKAIISVDDFDVPSNIRIGEDLIMNVRIAKKAKNVVVIEDVVYYYCVRVNSVCKTFVWTLSYAKKFEKILYNSLNKNFLKKYAFVVVFDMFYRRMAVLKGCVKSILVKKKLSSLNFLV